MKNGLEIGETMQENNYTYCLLYCCNFNCDVHTGSKVYNVLIVLPFPTRQKD